MTPDYFHCIVCERPLRAAFGPEEDDRHSPIDMGVHFQAFGNFGSTLFDPGPLDPERYAEVVICDWCLQERVSRVRVYNKDGGTQPFAEAIKDVVGPGPAPQG